MTNNIRRNNTGRNNTRRNNRNNNSKLKNITIGILAWKSPKTIANTLESYKNNGLLKMVHPIIYFQERTPEEDTLAKSYGINDIIGTDKNVGIIQSFMELINHTKTKYFIFAECDFELVNNQKRTAEILKECIDLMEKKGVDLIRLRDRENPGTPLGSHPINAGLKSKDKLNHHPMNSNFTHKIESLHFLEHPEKKFPGVFEVIDYKHRWFKTSSDNSPWSNNVFITSVAFLKDSVFPALNGRSGVSSNGKDDDLFSKMEVYLGKELKGYTIAGGPGLFKHNRLDR